MGSAHSIRHAIPIGKGCRSDLSTYGAGDLVDAFGRRRSWNRVCCPVPASWAEDSQSNRSYSYYDQDGIEHDFRLSAWSFDRGARPSGGG